MHSMNLAREPTHPPAPFEIGHQLCCAYRCGARAVHGLKAERQVVRRRTGHRRPARPPPWTCHPLQHSDSCWPQPWAAGNLASCTWAEVREACHCGEASKLGCGGASGGGAGVLGRGCWGGWRRHLALRLPVAVGPRPSLTYGDGCGNPKVAGCGGGATKKRADQSSSSLPLTRACQR